MNRLGLCLTFAIAVATAVPAAADPVVTLVDADLAAPFTFSYLGNSFTFAATGDVFSPAAVQTGGGGAISSFGGFLGIPVSPSPSFINRGTVVYDAGTRFAEFSALTTVPFSNGDNFFGLRATAGGVEYFGYAYTNNSLLRSYAFESTAGAAITAVAVPEPASWALMIVGVGVVGGAMRRRKAGVTTRIRFA